MADFSQQMAQMVAQAKPQFPATGGRRAGVYSGHVNPGVATTQATEIDLTGVTSLVMGALDRFGVLPRTQAQRQKLYENFVAQYSNSENPAQFEQAMKDPMSQAMFQDLAKGGMPFIKNDDGTLALPKPVVLAASTGHRAHWAGTQGKVVTGEGYAGGAAGQPGREQFLQTQPGGMLRDQSAVAAAEVSRPGITAEAMDAEASQRRAIAKHQEITAQPQADELASRGRYYDRMPQVPIKETPQDKAQTQNRAMVMKTFDTAMKNYAKDRQITQDEKDMAHKALVVGSAAHTGLAQLTAGGVYEEDKMMINGVVGGYLSASGEFANYQKEKQYASAGFFGGQTKVPSTDWDKVNRNLLNQHIGLFPYAKHLTPPLQEQLLKNSLGFIERVNPKIMKDGKLVNDMALKQTYFSVLNGMNQLGIDIKPYIRIGQERDWYAK